MMFWNSAGMTVELMIEHDDECYQYEWKAERTLARDMLAYVRDRLAEHQLTFAHIEGIGVFRGPGSFTGLRIGLTVLNTLARAQHIPIVGTTGHDWLLVAKDRLQSGDDDQLVVPEYGGPAHITKQRK